MNNDVTNIRLAGVGGQGIVAAGDVLADVLLESGFDVKKSEIHGMAQRGGTVNTDVRFGEKVYSPIIPDGEVDILLAFEQMEGLRHLPFLRVGSLVILSEQRILPSTVATGALRYPEDIPNRLARRAQKVFLVGPLNIAIKIGSIRSVNICLLGVLSRFLDVREAVWQEVITERFRDKALDANLRAFELGKTALVDCVEGSSQAV